MKIIAEVITYITPDKGQSIIELAEEIAIAKKEGKVSETIFLNLPNGERISLTGKTTSELRDSISTQWAGASRF